jgi:hypothetical protein
MQLRIRFQSLLRLALSCLAVLVGRVSDAADINQCKTGDEPHVICFYSVGDWGCNGPCDGAGKYGPVTIFLPPPGYQVCKPLITRQEVKGGECSFAGGPTELQIACTAPSAATQARVREITVYSISRSAPRDQFDRYKCVKW